MKKWFMKITIGLFFVAVTLGPLCAFTAEEKPLAPGEGTAVADADKEDVDRPTASLDEAATRRKKAANQCILP